MSKKNLDFKVDYKKLNILDEFNTLDIKYPIVLSSPHAGTVFPQEFLDNTSLSIDELRDSEDVYATELIMPASNAGIPLVSLNIHRTFVDVNRDKIEVDESMYFNKSQNDTQINPRRCRYGLGVIHRIVSQNKEIYDGLLSYNEVEERFKNVYDEYHKKLKQLIDKVKRKFGFCLLIDCHSMPSKICSVMNETKTVDFCIGNLFGESCSEKVSSFLKEELEIKDYRVELNRPYTGAFITFNYCQPRQNLYTLHLEINKSLYMDETVYKKSDKFQDVSTDISASIIGLGDFLLDFKQIIC
ncbi:MAG: N-formylglutamate amidohydrolase [Lactobacillaceae bacterium]|nr:N-formylglutamate amidohydrolase [Lactobacillaceae bacterium]